ncbi:hypothetical protein EG328_004341 [Venturia inaequalis]|uniref:Uncharacterized protein n=1 Tax=Venturia inaequalis TaxID=5025 RepID=A0A8H3UD81_VENIN|nr:hypothetical protein EG327_011518 [Venturia inaequalis]KAE9986899.1 hypothetical protein EG328_004341 [Venturia inaequalis]RDI81026.1 hypothetical protein Vi05172_g8944 [Venturia inaequalis]
MFSPTGVKVAGQNRACSSGGTNTLKDPIYVFSSITANSPKYDRYILSCTIIKSGTTDIIVARKPCPKTGTLIRIAGGATYQACIETAASVAPNTIAFTWHLGSPAKKRRGLDSGKPLSEIFTIIGNNSTADNPFQIVIGD